MQTKGAMMTKKPTKKNAKKSKTEELKLDTPEDLYKAVSDITLSRKSEIEEDADLSKAICELANVAQDNFMTLVKDVIKTGDETAIKKDTLLVLQLMYLKLSSDLVANGKKIEITSEIPTSGLGSVEPIDTSKNNVPLYL